MLKNIERTGIMKYHFQLIINNIETKHAVSLLSRNTVDNISDNCTDSKVKRKICNKQSSPLTNSRDRNRFQSYSNHRNWCSSINFHSPPNVNLHHQSIYYILIITLLLLINNNRTQKIVHVPRGRAQFPVLTLVSPDLTIALDLHEHYPSHRFILLLLHYSLFAFTSLHQSSFPKQHTALNSHPVDNINSIVLSKKNKSIDALPEPKHSKHYNHTTNYISLHQPKLNFLTIITPIHKNLQK